MIPFPSDNSTLLRLENFALGFTQSEITTWDDCAEKWYLGYNHMLQKKGEFSWHFVYGDAFHRSLEAWYASGGVPSVASLQFPLGVILSNEQEAEAKLKQKILDVQMERYFSYYRDDLTLQEIWLNEQIITVEFEGVKLTGKLDRGFTFQGIDVLVDHKSAGRFDPASLNGWHFRFQFMFYLWLARMAFPKRILNRFQVNMLKKPALRQGVKESIETFVARVRQDMIQRPEEYFKRVELSTIKGSMEHFEERVLKPKIQRIKMLTQCSDPAIIEVLVRNQNTSNCVKYGSTCQFLPICQNSWKLEGFQYQQRETKHEELEAE